MKPVEQMSLEEIQAERDAIAAARSSLANGTVIDVAIPDPTDTLSDTKPAAAQGDDTLPTPREPWPHEFLQIGDDLLEVRKPTEGALLAISVSGSLGLDPETQMSIFSGFLKNHLSPDSLVVVLQRMSDPESDFTAQTLVTELSRMA